jgi:hypothetical protein
MRTEEVIVIHPDLHEALHASDELIYVPRQGWDAFATVYLATDVEVRGGLGKPEEDGCVLLLLCSGAGGRPALLFTWFTAVVFFLLKRPAACTTRLVLIV